jgi:AbrB family looped-hinge helix DNA binding protein
MRPATGRISAKGQVTLPIAVRRALGLAPRDKVAFDVRDGEVRVRRIPNDVLKIAGMFRDRVPGPVLPEVEKQAASIAVAEEVIASLDR